MRNHGNASGFNYQMVNGHIRLKTDRNNGTSITSVKTINFKPFRTIRITYNTVLASTGGYDSRIRLYISSYMPNGSNHGGFGVNTDPSIDHAGQGHVLLCDVSKITGQRFLRLSASCAMGVNYVDITKIEFLT